MGMNVLPVDVVYSESGAHRGVICMLDEESYQSYIEALKTNSGAPSNASLIMRYSQRKVVFKGGD